MVELIQSSFYAIILVVTISLYNALDAGTGSGKITCAGNATVHWD